MFLHRSRRARRRIPHLAAAIAATGVAALALAGVQGTALAASAAPHPAAAKAAAAVFNVKDYGATGNGSTNDSPAINKAVAAANTAGGGIVEFPSGSYKSANTVHLKSNVTIQLDAGSKVLGSSAKTYDAAESNPNDKYQDYGHSHFHDAMFSGDKLSNIGFTGSGTIDGGGNLITGNPGAGQADKILSLTRCTNLTLSGITLTRGGHFGALINGCDGVVSDHLTIATSSDRDGWNIISTTHVTITNANISSNDDALVFKSDWALGQTLPSGHVTVTNSTLQAKCCNALMFGSETCGSFTDYRFQQITILGAGKSGLGIVSMDGADISDVHYQDVTMTGVHSPIMEKIGTRLRCGGSPKVGHISNVTFTNVTGTGVASTDYSPTIWGADSSHQVSDETFTNVNLTVPGGHGTMSTGVPSDNGDYNPNSIGTRPAYGWYLHNVSGIHFTGGSVKVAKTDGRPAVIANAGSAITFDGLTAQTGSSSPFDVGFQNITGYCLSNSHNTSGGALRVSASGSTQSCGSSATRYEAENATLSTGDTVATNHTGFSGSGFVDTTNAVGAYVEWTVTAPAAGTYTATVGYANGTTTDRPMDVAVNGTTADAAASFPTTASWNTWAGKAFSVPLNAGANTIRVAASTANGCPNLDYLDLG
ncbi:Carbohydrate binding family 6 [Catenulispora acidiphila DSM 44928]|uniref:Carbohydrate binding family 6 n=2 Tax=Catenulispora TaxID=414878 RepID=C7Q950_CATAD|nr:Carbohydrate binding family 6 [Catenulispora acidiphila DSM 44928]